ncbi:MAG TPA: hypothetical protein VMY80_00495 [Anaerolineae bacterium]|nr:hypothetical protein [Anaerolineae bacterium]
MSELRRLSAGTSFTKDSLDHFFDSLSGAVWNDIGLLGFLREGDRVAEFRRNGREVPTQLYGNVGLIGSGRVDIERFIGTGQMPGGLERPMNGLEQSLGYGLYLTGTFLNLEQVTGESLTRYYGGGYEIASLMGDKFGKRGDVTYIFWRARADDGNPRLYKQPSRLFRYAYEGDLLVIRAFAFEGSPPAPTARDDLHYVTPVYRDPTPKERGWVDDPYSGPAPSLDASWLCNYILTAFPNGKVGVLTLVCLKAPGQDRWVSIKETAAGTEIMVSDEFINLVSRQIGEELKTMT